MKKFIISIFCLFFYFNYAFAQSHTVFVLDTSKSVLQNQYFDTMKESINEIISFLDEDNEISLFTFDEEVKKVFIKKIISENNIQDNISSIAAEGFWTDTRLMLKEVVEFLQNEYGKPVNLYIFSDGIDDPSPNKEVLEDFEVYNNENSNIVYVYYVEQENEEQKELILEAFPQILLQRLTGSSVSDSQILITNLNELIPKAQIEFQEGIRGQLPTGVDSNLSINIIANQAASGKEALLNIIPSTNFFALYPERQTRFIIQEGINNFRFPYKIKNSFQGKTTNLNFTLSLAEAPEKSLQKRNANLQIAPLPFIERLYKLPLYAIPALFIALMLFYMIYRILYYQFFVPIIQMQYYLVKNEEEKAVVSSLEMGLLENIPYTISANPDAYLVLPELSKYAELVLVKKGKKFTTRLLIHSRSLRNVTTLDGKRVNKRRIKNGAAFQLDNYIFRFKTNLK